MSEPATLTQVEDDIDDLQNQNTVYMALSIAGIVLAALSVLLVLGIRKRKKTLKDLQQFTGGLLNPAFVPESASQLPRTSAAAGFDPLDGLQLDPLDGLQLGGVV